MQNEQNEQIECKVDWIGFDWIRLEIEGDWWWVTRLNRPSKTVWWLLKQ